MTENSKVVNARLSEDELAALNNLMARHGCKNLAELLRMLIGSKITLNAGSIEGITKDLAEVKDALHTIVYSLGMGSRVENGTTNLLNNSIGVAEGRINHELFPASDPQGITGSMTLYLLPHSLRGARCCTAG